MFNCRAAHRNVASQVAPISLEYCQFGHPGYKSDHGPATILDMHYSVVLPYRTTLDMYYSEHIWPTSLLHSTILDIYGPTAILFGTTLDIYGPTVLLCNTTLDIYGPTALLCNTTLDIYDPQHYCLVLYWTYMTLQYHCIILPWTYMILQHYSVILPWTYDPTVLLCNTTLDIYDPQHYWLTQDSKVFIWPLFTFSQIEYDKQLHKFLIYVVKETSIKTTCGRWHGSHLYTV